jgi:hypothetical protein
MALGSPAEAAASASDASQQSQAPRDDYDFQKHQGSHLRFPSLLMHPF